LVGLRCDCPTLRFSTFRSRNKEGTTAVNAKSKRKPLAERLKDGLTEAIQFAKGELTLRTVQVPDPPPEIAAKEVTSLLFIRGQRAEI